MVKLGNLGMHDRYQPRAGSLQLGTQWDETRKGWGIGMKKSLMELTAGDESVLTALTHLRNGEIEDLREWSGL